MKNTTLFAIMLAWVVFAFVGGFTAGEKTGSNRVKEDVASTASFYIDYHKDNLKNQIADYKDCRKYGWDIAEAKFGNTAIGEVKAYENILREVTKK